MADEEEGKGVCGYVIVYREVSWSTWWVDQKITLACGRQIHTVAHRKAIADVVHTIYEWASIHELPDGRLQNEIQDNIVNHKNEHDTERLVES